MLSSIRAHSTEESLQTSSKVEPIAIAHNCSDCAVLTAEDEIVCMRCGVVLDEETAGYLRENCVSHMDGMAATLQDHNPGNGLLNSQTIQDGYVSRRNPGTAMLLGSRLNNAYKSGLVADPSKGCHMEEDVLTGKTKLKFSPYDLSTLQLIKEKTLQECTHYGLDTVVQTLISKEAKRLYSHLVMTEIIEYIKLVSILKYRHSLPKATVLELELRLAKCIAQTREKILSGCASKTEKE